MTKETAWKELMKSAKVSEDVEREFLKERHMYFVLGWDAAMKERIA